MSLPVIPKTLYLYTEAEARVMGAAANRLATLRSYRDNGTGGSLVIKDKTGSSSSLSLSDDEVFSVLALLIERATATLTGFNVECDESFLTSDHIPR